MGVCVNKLIKPLAVPFFLIGSLLSTTVPAAPRAVDGNNKVVLKLQAMVKEMTVEIDGNWGLLRPEKNVTEQLLLLLIGVGQKMTH